MLLCLCLGIRSHGHQQRLRLHHSLNPVMGPSRSPAQAIILALGGNETTHLSPLLIYLASSDMPLFMGHELFVFLFPTLLHTFAHYSNAHLLGAKRCQVGQCILLGASGGLTQACMHLFLSCLDCHGPRQDHASSSQRDDSSARPLGTRILVGVVV